MHSFAEVLEDPRHRDCVAWHTVAGSARVGICDMVFRPSTVRTAGVPHSALTVHRNTAMISHQVRGARRQRRKFVPGDLILRPPALEYTTRYEDEGHVTVFALDTEVVRSTTTAFGADVGGVFARLGLRPFRSPLVEGLATQLADGAAKGFDRIYLDSLTTALIHELWRIAGGALHPAETMSGRLSPRQLRRIDEVIAEAPGGQIALARLARAVGMSMTAFSAALKATAGVTPYQYVLSRRLAHARDLVETTKLALAEIAHRSGFASQSHMTDVFRAKLGTTPGRLRAERA